jgi:hypothetical protein
LILRAGFDFDPLWTVKGDVHFFKAAAEYENYLGDDTKDIGSELDITVVTTSVPGAILTGGASVFLPSESFAGRDDPGANYWLYTMVEVYF